MYRKKTVPTLNVGLERPVLAQRKENVSCLSFCLPEQPVRCQRSHATDENRNTRDTGPYSGKKRSHGVDLPLPTTGEYVSFTTPHVRPDRVLHRPLFPPTVPPLRLTRTPGRTVGPPTPTTLASSDVTSHRDPEQSSRPSHSRLSEGRGKRERGGMSGR